MYTLKFFITCLITSLAFTQDPELLLERGQNELISGYFLESEQTFQKALQIDPSFAPALQALSKLSLHKGDLKRANEYSNQAVQADEDFRGWSLKIGKISEQIQNGNRNVQQGLYKEAIIEYEKILKTHPYFPDAEFYMGLTRFRQKDIEKAARHFSNALKIYPDHIKARKGLDNVTKQFLNIGNKSYKNGDLSKAIKFYNKSLEFDPEFYLAYFQLGVLAKKQENSKLAISNLNKVLELKPEHDKTWFTLGTVYESDQLNDEAIEHYLKAIEINPGYSKAYGNVGKVLTEKEEYAKAEDLLKTIIQIDPSFADGYMRLGLLYIAQEKFKEAVDNLKSSVQLDDNDYNKFFNLALAHNKNEEWSEAGISAQKCVDLKRKFGGGWLELGISELGKKNRTRAKKHFEKAREYREWREVAERKIDEINNPAKYQK
jgi:tetratricopeptide (TPR) repeat protein